MPKAWVRIEDSPNPKPIRGPQFDRDVKDCERKTRCDPRKTEKHDEGDHVCIGVEPKTETKGDEFAKCMRDKGYETAKVDQGCADKHEKPRP